MIRRDLCDCGCIRVRIRIGTDLILCEKDELIQRQVCWACDGYAHKSYTRRTFQGMVTKTKRCDTCDGTGEMGTVIQQGMVAIGPEDCARLLRDGDTLENGECLLAVHDCVLAREPEAVAA